MAAEPPIAIEVVHALREKQQVVLLTVPLGTTAVEAVRLSRLPEGYPTIDPHAAQFGIHGRVVPGDTVLRDGDRVEIYRPLRTDPKMARRRRAVRAGRKRAS